MTKEEKAKTEIEQYENLLKRELTEKEKDSIYKKYINPIPTEIELEDAEIDYRKLSEEDYKQLVMRKLNYEANILTQLYYNTNMIVKYLVDKDKGEVKEDE